MKEKPKWAKPLNGEQECSICSNKDVFYAELVQWETEKNSTSLGRVITHCLGAKCYCLECFTEYGGNPLNV